MIAMKDGTKVYFRGEWDKKLRDRSIYEARKLGGTPAAKVVGSALIVWQQRPPKVTQTELVTIVRRLAAGLHDARKDALTQNRPRWEPPVRAL